MKPIPKQRCVNLIIEDDTTSTVLTPIGTSPKTIRCSVELGAIVDRCTGKTPNPIYVECPKRELKK